MAQVTEQMCRDQRLMSEMTRISGRSFNVAAIRNHLNRIAVEACDSGLRVTASTADDLIAALLIERTDFEFELQRLRQRCEAMAFLLWPLDDGPRAAVDGDFGLRSSSSGS